MFSSVPEPRSVPRYFSEYVLITRVDPHQHYTAFRILPRAPILLRSPINVYKLIGIHPSISASRAHIP